MTWLPANQGVSENPGIGKKVLGGTLVALGLGGLLWFLTRNAWADDGTNGTCATDADCPSGMVCQGGVCVLEVGPGDTQGMKFCAFEKKNIPRNEWSPGRCDSKWCQKEMGYVRQDDYSEARCSVKVGWILWKIKRPGQEWTETTTKKKNGWFECEADATLYVNITNLKRDHAKLFKGTILHPTGVAPRTDKILGSNLGCHWVQVVLP